jgi:HlyD family secretion protein
MKGMRPWVPIAVLAALAVAALAWFVVSRLPPPPGIRASGTIEAVETDLSPKVEGRLTALRVRDGDPVKTGQVLAVLERLDPSLDVDQASANVAAAQAQVAVAQAALRLQQTTYATTLAQAGAGVTIARSGLGQADENLDIEQPAAALAVDQAQAELVAAQSAQAHAQTDLERARALVATGDLAQQQLDDATNAAATSAAQLQAARDAVALALANRRTVRIRQLGVRASSAQHSQSLAALAAARAEHDLVVQRGAEVRTAQGQLAAARAALGLARDRVRETDVVAPFDGYVVSHNFEAGSLVQPGSALLTIGDLAHPYVYLYVSESDLPHVATGTRVTVAVDGLPGRTFAGAVTEIGTTAEFTPENVQTKDERVEYLVFRIKAQFDDTSGALKPGLPVDAIVGP